MDDRFAGVAAALVGSGLTAVTGVEFVVAGYPPPPAEPFVTGVLVGGAGLLLTAAGVVAAASSLDSLALRGASGVGLAGLALAVLQPGALRFGGVFWLGLVVAVLVAAGAGRTLAHLA